MINLVLHGIRVLPSSKAFKSLSGTLHRFCAPVFQFEPAFLDDDGGCGSAARCADSLHRSDHVHAANDLVR